jgi:cell division protein FtsL
MAIANRTLPRTHGEIARQALNVKPILFAVGALIVIVAVVQLVQTSRATTASFKIEQLQQQELELETSVSQLEVEVAGLSSLARIQQEANRLGLRPPASREVVGVSVPGPSGDSAQIPARLLQSDQAGTAAGSESSSLWDELLDHLPFH